MTTAFHNQSTNQLADDYGALDLQIKSLEAGKSDIKAELVKRGVTFVAGERFAVTMSEQSSARLDTKRLKEALGADICADYETVSTSIVARVKPVLQQSEAA